MTNYVTTRPRQVSWLARHGRLIAWTATALIFATAVGPNAPRILAYAASVEVNPHWPNAALWAAAPLKIKLHVGAAVAAFAIGLVILLKPKGTGFHRTLGWAWVLAMAATAISSLFITELSNGVWSFIHLFAGWTVVALPVAIFAIRRGHVRTHQRTMTGLFMGGLVVAGLLAFIPGRFMWRLFFG